MGAINKYRDLEVWQKAMELAELAYRVSSGLPAAERFGVGRLLNGLVDSLQKRPKLKATEHSSSPSPAPSP